MNIYQIIKGKNAALAAYGFPVVAPQHVAPPFWIYACVSTRTANTMTGYTELNVSRYNFDAFATTYAGAKTVADAIKGIMLQAWKDTGISYATLETELEGYDENEKLYQVTLSFMVTYLK